MLYFVGIGLADEKDISVKGLEAVKKADFIFLESYTSIFNCPVKDLENFYGRKIIKADRNLVEKNSDEILDKAKAKNVCFLVAGDPMCATTHADLLLRAKEKNVEVEIIHNASIVSAIGAVGLEVYKFGKITSIPFENKNVKSPYEAMKVNLKNKMHTLFLIDLRPDENKFLTIKEAIEYLIREGMKKTMKVLACARIGSKSQKIAYGEAEKLLDIDFGNPPYCLVVPAELHFMEEGMLKLYSVIK